MENMTFDDLTVGMRIFDMEEEEFGEILGKETDDMLGGMLDVKWDNNDPNIEDRSYVMSGKAIGVVVESGTPMMEHIMSTLGDDIRDVADEHGDNFSLVNMVDIW